MIDSRKMEYPRPSLLSAGEVMSTRKQRKPGRALTGSSRWCNFIVSTKYLFTLLAAWFLKPVVEFVDLAVAMIGPLSGKIANFEPDSLENAERNLEPLRNPVNQR